jgi:hypothetical protein
LERPGIHEKNVVGRPFSKSNFTWQNEGDNAGPNQGYLLVGDQGSNASDHERKPSKHCLIAGSNGAERSEGRLPLLPKRVFRDDADNNIFLFDRF